jgi:predicted O-linked N-acetylglucosamine transferase (SPINDLY family)
VFGRRPAPVQATYLGYPNTTGLRAIQYRITDVVCDPPGESVRHTEELTRLPGGFSCYAPPAGAPPGRPPSDDDAARPVTFGSLHKASRLNEDVIDLWSQLLLRMPNARLLLLRHELYGGTARRVAQLFARHGLDESRVRITNVLPSGGHLAAYHEIDISLDTFPWSGHTTACESMWMGVPVVTLYGDRHAGRMVSSVLTQLGLTDLIAHTPQQYVEIGSNLAGDRARLRELRSTLRDRMSASPLCDGRGRTRELESAYREMWARWCGATLSAG